MKLRYRYANHVVGAFVVIALALTAALLVSMGVNQRWFRRNYDYHSQFSSAKDLSVGMAVSFRGFTIGRVTRITLNEDNEVDVVFSIQEEYIDKVTADSLIQLVTNPLGGGQILFHQGRERTPPLPEGSYIPTFNSKQGMRLREENRVIILRDADPIAQILGQVDPILLNVDRLLLSLNALAMEIDLTLKGGATGPVAGILDGLEAAVHEIQLTIEQANALIGDTSVQVDRLVSEVEEVLSGTAGIYAGIDTVFGNVDALFASVDGLFAGVQEIFEDVGGIAKNIEATTAALTDPTGLVPRLLDPKGSVATFLDDDNLLYDQLTAAVAGIEQTVAGIEQTIAELEGSLAEFTEFTRYLNTARPQLSILLEEGRATLSTGQDVLEGLRNNPLIRGGIPAVREQPTTFRSLRDEDMP